MDGDGFAAADFDGLNLVGLVAVRGDAQTQLHIRLFVRAQIGYPKHRPAVGFGDHVLGALGILVVDQMHQRAGQGIFIRIIYRDADLLGGNNGHVKINRVGRVFRIFQTFGFFH